MLVRLTSGNRLALPETVLTSCKGTEHFDVTEENGRIVLTPVWPDRAGAVRSSLADRGIGEDDVARAVAWARGRDAG